MFYEQKKDGYLFVGCVLHLLTLSHNFQKSAWVKVFLIMLEFRICDGRWGRFSKSRKSCEKMGGGAGKLMLQQNYRLRINRLESQVSKYSNDYFERPIITMLSVPIFQS